MRTSPNGLVRSVLSLLLGGVVVGAAAAQVPDGWFVFGSFQGTAGHNGIYFAHPRDSAAPWIEVTGLSPALAYDPAGRRGAACVARRADGALVVGERAPAGTSVDVHVLQLSGNAVTHAQLFSMGTSANVGEVPQLAVLPDGRVVVAATDLAPGGPLAQFQTLLYNWEGVGILDPVSGSVSPIPIQNLNQFPGVINGMAVDVVSQTVYVGNYISSVAGDLWAVPLVGGTATQVANLPAGASNVAVDLDGTVLVTTLNGPPNLFRYDPATGATTSIPTTTGPLNAIAIETVTGNYALATANAGTPPRSLVWSTSTGQETVLLSPNLATISGIDCNPNPEAYGEGAPGTVGYAWQLRPNPGGLPLVGNGTFSLTLAADAPSVAMAVMAIGFDRAPAGATIAGMPLHVDLAGAVGYFATFQDEFTAPLPIPGNAALIGLELRAQALLLELATQTLAASSGVEFTVL